MTILYPAPAAVKSTRRFADGILPPRPVYAADHTAADEVWLIADNARREAEARNRLIDCRYTEAYATDCVSLGLIPNDAAEFLGAKSFIGHGA